MSPLDQNDDQLGQLLRDSLAHQAGRVNGGPRMEQVVGRARRIRRRRRQLATAVAAAAVVLVTVPTAVALRPDADAPLPTHHNTPPPAPGPSRTPPSPHGTPTTHPSRHATPNSGPTTLAAIPLGSMTSVSYLDGQGLVHDNGTTQPLPGKTTDVTSFHDFRGGWVVINDISGLTEYASDGSVVHHGTSGGIAVSGDRTEVAWQIGHTVYYGPDNTMGNGGPVTMSVPSGGNLIGFLPQGPAVGYQNQIAFPDSSGKGAQTEQLPLYPETVSQSADLIGGIAGSIPKNNLQGAVYDPTTHRILWKNDWRPASFSDDGKYVAASPAGDNGDPEYYAILNARTGAVVAQTPKLGSGVFLNWGVAWDGDRLIFEGSGGKAEQTALLSLSTTGEFTRASVVIPTKPGSLGFRFAAQP